MTLHTNQRCGWNNSLKPDYNEQYFIMNTLNLINLQVYTINMSVQVSLTNKWVQYECTCVFEPLVEGNVHVYV